MSEQNPRYTVKTISQLFRKVRNPYHSKRAATMHARDLNRADRKDNGQ